MILVRLATTALLVGAALPSFAAQQTKTFDCKKPRPHARFVRQPSGCDWAAHNSAHPGAAIDECVRASLEERVRRLRGVVARSGT